MSAGHVRIPGARLLPESFLLGVITIPRAQGLPGVKLLEANTFLEAFLQETCYSWEHMGSWNPHILIIAK